MNTHRQTRTNKNHKTALLTSVAISCLTCLEPTFAATGCASADTNGLITIASSESWTTCEIQPGISIINNGAIKSDEGDTWEYPKIEAANKNAPTSNITNNGLILSPYKNSSEGNGIAIEQSFIGMLLNNASGEIRGGITVDQSTIDAFENHGLIERNGWDWDILMTNSTINRHFLNTGTIGRVALTDLAIGAGITNSGSFEALLIANSTLSESVINTGSIKPPDGVISGAVEIKNNTFEDFINDSTGSITGKERALTLQGNTFNNLINNGVISTDTLYALWFQANNFNTLTNNGTIAVENNENNENNGVFLHQNQGNTFTNNGTISNSGIGAGLTSAGNRINDFINYGSISAESGYGVLFYMDEYNNIINHGTITITSALSPEVEENYDFQPSLLFISDSTISGTIANHGTLEGAQTGLYVHNSAIQDGIINTGNIISGKDNYAVDIAENTTAINFVNAGKLDGHVLIDGLSDTEAVTLRLEQDAIVTGKIDGHFGIVDIVANNFTANNDWGTTARLSSINIHSGAVLNTTGNGSIAANTNEFHADTLSNDGTLSILAGNTVAITGDYTQSASGVLNIGANSNEDYGKLFINGNATFADNTGIFVDVSSTAAFTPEGTLADVIAVNESGTLNASNFLVNTNSLLFVFEAVIDENTVDLITSAKKSGVEKAVINEGLNHARGAAIQLDKLFSGAPTGDMATIRNAFVSFTNEADVADAANQTLPILTGGTNKAVMQAMNTMNTIIQARNNTNTGLSSGDQPTADKNFWLKPFGTWASQDNRKRIAGFDADTRGFITGVDYAATNALRLGGAISYANIDIDGNDKRSNMDIDSYSLIGYGSYALDDRTEANAQVGAGKNTNEGERRINFSNINRVAKSDYHSYTAHAGAGIGRTYDIAQNTTLSPSLRVDYSVIKNKNYTEKEAGALNLKVKSQTEEQFITMVGAKLSHELVDDLKLSVNAGVGYDAMADKNKVTSSFVGGGGSFVTKGIESSSWLTRTGVALTYLPDANTDVSLQYEREDRGSHFENETIFVKARFAF